MGAREMPMSRIALRTRLKTAALAGAIALMAGAAFSTAHAAVAMRRARALMGSGADCAQGRRRSGVEPRSGAAVGWRGHTGRDGRGGASRQLDGDEPRVRG